MDQNLLKLPSSVAKDTIIYLVIFIFFLLKLSHLSTPYYWDELGVYTKASLYMYDHGVTLFPGIIPAELSRGHPLLCAAIFGGMYKLFGPYVWAGHLTALMLSCLLLIVFFRLCKIVVGSIPAIVACVIFMVQPVFIAQSGMVLPEIMLSFFCTGALLSYIKRNYILLALWSALAIMTKETAIALPAAIFVIELLSMLLRRGLNKDNLCFIVSALFPVILWGGFLIVQKIQHGWFFFPLHSDYVSFSFQQVFSRGCYYLSFLFKGQGRYVWTIVCGLCLLLFIRTNHKTILRNFGLFIKNGVLEREPWTILLSFCAMALIASSLNFHLARYSLFFLPAVILLLMSFCSQALKSFSYTLLIPPIVGVVVIVPFFYYEAKVFTFDADMGFQHAVATQKAATEFLDKNFKADTAIMSDFPMSTGLKEQRAGYTKKKYLDILNGCGKEDLVDAFLYIYTYPGNLEICQPQTENLVQIKEFKSSFAKVQIYQKQ